MRGDRAVAVAIPVAIPVAVAAGVAIAVGPLAGGKHAFALTGARVPAEVVVRGAGAFGGHHARADRRLRRASGAENLALPRLENAFEDLAALAGLGVGDADARYGEHLLRVVLRELVLQLESALADEAEPAPLEMRAQLEHACEHLERLRVAIVVNDPLVLVLDFAASLLYLLDDHVHALEDVERLESDHDHRLVVGIGHELERPDPDHGGHVSR